MNEAKYIGMDVHQATNGAKEYPQAEDLLPAHL